MEGLRRSAVPPEPPTMAPVVVPASTTWWLTVTTPVITVMVMVMVMTVVPVSANHPRTEDVRYLHVTPFFPTAVNRRINMT